MEGAPVTAATGVLGPVVAKLGALLGSEYKLRRRTRKDVKFIKSKLKSVHSILWMVWEKEDLDAESKVLKKEALDLAADMEDAIDDFILTMERSRRNIHLMVQSKIKASPFQDFRTRVDDVSARCRSKWKWEKNKYAEPISNLFSRKNAKSSAPSKPPPPQVPFVRKDPSELVGMGEWREDLITYLVGGEEDPMTSSDTMVQPQLKMASIVGMAGMGKTTLAHLVYEDEEIEKKFQCRAFVSVTRTPNMMEVLTSILQQVGAAGTEARTEEDITHTISNFLKDKRYLVIIDDIWHREEWEVIEKSFPQNNLGSRIIITTRIRSVTGDSFNNNELCIRMNPVWMPSMEIWNYRPDIRMPDMGRWHYRPYMEVVTALMKPDMVGEGFDCNHPIVLMCGGVPLALLCMFSAMALVQEQHKQLGVHVNAHDVQDMIEKKVKRSGIHNTPGFEPLVARLQLGYDDLPNHMLKTCLLYSSIYPEHYPFVGDDLAMRWVAEGFINKEDASKGYIEEFVNRGLMLHQPRCFLMENWKEDGEAYQMNPMMRNFLRWKSREDNFITCSSDITSAYAFGIHRLCIDDYPVDDGAVEGVDPLFGLDWSRIRSLVVSEDAMRYVPFEKLERVRVLNFQYNHFDIEFNADLGNDHVKDICGLLRVRHLLGLHGMRISEIPPEIARLQCLEILQLKGTLITKLPSEIGNLQQLKTLDISGNKELVELPMEIGDLHHLETLRMGGTKITKLPNEIGDLQQLKTLDISGNKYLAELPREIGNLKNLETLCMGGTKITKLNGEIIGKLKKLKTLDMSRNLIELASINQGITELPREIGDLKNLETLDLSYNTGLTKLPREIGNLQNLKQLLLTFTEVKLPKEIGGLKKLKKLAFDESISALPWEAAQLSEVEGVPEWVRQVMKNSDLLSSELAGEILSVRMVRGVGDRRGLIVGTKHMHIPRWIKDHFSDLAYLDIRICKLEEQDLKILREMPNLYDLKLRLEVIPRKPIAISGEGFTRLEKLVVDSRVPLVITFQEGAMPVLYRLWFEHQFYGGPPANTNPPALGIKHLRRLGLVEFICNEEWYGGAAESMSAMIDVVRKEAQEHPNQIEFYVSGRECEIFPAANKESAQVAQASSTSSEMEEEIPEA